MSAYPLIILNGFGSSPFQLVLRPIAVYKESANEDVFNLGVVAAVSAGASLTYSLQVTADQIPSDSGNWVDHDIITGKTASAVSNIDYPITAYRLNVTSYTSGSVTLGVTFWPGLGPFVGSNGAA